MQNPVVNPAAIESGNQERPLPKASAKRLDEAAIYLTGRSVLLCVHFVAGRLVTKGDKQSGRHFWLPHKIKKHRQTSTKSIKYKVENGVSAMRILQNVIPRSTDTSDRIRHKAEEAADSSSADSSTACDENGRPPPRLSEPNANLATPNAREPNQAGLKERLQNLFSKKSNTPSFRGFHRALARVLEHKQVGTFGKASLAKITAKLPPEQAALFSDRPGTIALADWVDMDKLSALTRVRTEKASDTDKTEKLNEALLAYSDADTFAFLDDSVKWRHIDAMAEVATEKGIAALERMHLPRVMSGGRGKPGTIIRYGIEQEGVTYDRILEWYGPKDGILPEMYLSDELVSQLFVFPGYEVKEMEYPEDFQKKSISEKKSWVTEHLKWKNLSPVAKAKFTETWRGAGTRPNSTVVWPGPKDGTLSKELVDDGLLYLLFQVDMYRPSGIEYPQDFAKRSLEEQRSWLVQYVKWENLCDVAKFAYFEKFRGEFVRQGFAPLWIEEILGKDAGVWEIRTQGSLSSLDQLYRALKNTSDLTGIQDFHVHVSFEPEGEAGLGEQDPAGTLLADTLVLTNLMTFAMTAAENPQAFHLEHLKLHQTDDYPLLLSVLKDGHCCDCKYHFIGLRTMLYDDAWNVFGFEIRSSNLLGKENGVQNYGKMAEFWSDLLVQGALVNEFDFDETRFLLPKSPTPEAVFETASEFMNNHPCFEPFSFPLRDMYDVLAQALSEAVAGGSNCKPIFDAHVITPLMPWEDLPFVSDLQKDQIVQARETFVQGMAKLVQNVRKMSVFKMGAELDRLLQAFFWAVIQQGQLDQSYREFLAELSQPSETDVSH